MSRYFELAQIYDNTIDMDYEKWTKFLMEYFTAKEMELRGKKLLELGCGTGNMTLRLKEKGMDIVALDLSQEMLQNAMEKAIKKRYKIMFVNQDMTKFEMHKKFDFIFSFCDAYNYITEESKLEESFKRVHSHLAQGGYFVFDISTAYKLSQKIGNYTFTRNEEELCYIWDNYIDEKDDTLEMYISFFVKEGALYRRFKEHHLQKMWKNEYMLVLLKKVGFSEVEAYDDYTMNNVSDVSTRAVFVCRK